MGGWSCQGIWHWINHSGFLDFINVGGFNYFLSGVSNICWCYHNVSKSEVFHIFLVNDNFLWGVSIGCSYWLIPWVVGCNTLFDCLGVILFTEHDEVKVAVSYVYEFLWYICCVDEFSRLGYFTIRIRVWFSNSAVNLSMKREGGVMFTGICGYYIYPILQSLYCVKMIKNGY